MGLNSELHARPVWPRRLLLFIALHHYCVVRCKAMFSENEILVRNKSKV